MTVSRWTRLARARQTVGIWRIDIAQLNIAIETQGHRPEADGNHAFEIGCIDLFQGFAARNAALQHCGVIEFLPDIALRGCNLT